MKLSIFVLITMGVLLVFAIVLSILRWQKSQNERKQKALTVLSTRSHRLLFIFQTVSDRYLPATAKKILLEYALSINAQLVKASFDADAKLRQAEFMTLLSELKIGKQAATKMRITSQEQLTKTQYALQYLPRILHKLAENRVIDKSTVKHHIGLLRYSYSLAYRDLLVKQATQDLDMDKKGRALEKYRTALAEMERVSADGHSGKEITRLKSMIDAVEKELFQQSK